MDKWSNRLSATLMIVGTILLLMNLILWDAGEEPPQLFITAVLIWIVATIVDIACAPISVVRKQRNEVDSW